MQVSLTLSMLTSNYEFNFLKLKIEGNILFYKALINFYDIKIEFRDHTR